MKLKKARRLAEKWVGYLRPECERIEIAGSIRREKADVGDIEIVCIPRTEVEKDMFGYVVANKSRLETLIDGMIYKDMCKPIKNGKKYKKLALPQGINIDLFIVRQETWAVQFTIRTGPSDFSHWIVTQRAYGGALPDECNVSDGKVWRYGVQIDLQEEADFFNFLGLGWIDPCERKAGYVVR